MNKSILCEYGRLRHAGYSPAESLRGARIVVAFLEAGRAGLVQLVQHPEHESYFDAYGEPEGYVNQYGRRVSAEQERAELVDSIERLGCWYISAEVREVCDKCGRGEWEVVDGVGMCTGYENPLSPYENAYVIDMMAAALERVESFTTASKQMPVNRAERRE